MSDGSLEPLRGPIRKTLFFLFFTGIFFPPLASFYFLLESGAWSSKELAPPKLEELRDFAAKPKVSPHEGRILLRKIFTSPPVVGFTWPVSFILFCFLIRANWLRNAVTEILTKRNTAVGCAFLAGNVIYFYLAQLSFPYLEARLQNKTLRIILIVFLWLPLFGGVGFLYAKKRGETIGKSLGVAWRMVGRYYFVLMVYASFLTLLLALLTWIWIAPLVVLVEALKIHPGIIEVAPVVLLSGFRTYVSLLLTYWREISLYVLVLCGLIIPGVFLSGYAFWRTIDPPGARVPEAARKVLDHFHDDNSA